MVDTIPARVHIVGVGGSGMSGLAKLLSQLGHEITGSDLKPGRMLDALADVGVVTWVGHRPDAAARADLVVASSAVPDVDPEIAAAVAAGVDVWRRPRLLHALTSMRRTVGLAGTHGKTTSTALAVTALRETGHDPSFLVGGELVGLNTGASLGADNLFVLEADEAFGTFRHLVLDSMLVTNIEADHLDHYRTVAELEDAFAQVASRVSAGVVGCVDDPGVRRLNASVGIVGYGFGSGARWRITDVRDIDGGVAFRLAGDETIDVWLPQPGEHIASNAAGVLVLLHTLGYALEPLAEAMRSYTGVRRRYEVRAEINGVTIVDDYAHHPTEVAATIAAARRSTTGRVIAAFQPHRYSRTADLGPEFGEPLALADRVVVTNVYPAGERPIIGVSGRLVANAVTAADGAVEYVRRLADVPERLAGYAEAGDTVLLLGAGDITSIAPDVARLVEEQT